MDSDDATRRFYAEIWPHAATVQRAAQFLTRNTAEADDLAQETMIKAFRNLDRFRQGTDVKAWLMTILRNARIDRVRSAAAMKEVVGLSEAAAELEAPPHEVAGDDEQLWQNPEAMMQGFSDSQVIAALGELPEDIRWTLLLVDVEGLDHVEAARILEVPVGTIKSRAHRGRAMLREHLAPVAREMRLMR